MTTKDQLKASLEERKRLIEEEIDHYPAPITACDAQFNYLLHERTRITEQLKELEESEVSR